MLRFEEQQQNISIPIQSLRKLLIKSWQNCCLNQWMDAQELEDAKKVSATWVKNVNKTVNKMNNTVSSMIDMKPKDAIKLNAIPLDKKYLKETMLPEDGLYRCLYQPCEQHGDQNRRGTDLIWSKIRID